MAREGMMARIERPMTPAEALGLILDQVDYTNGACGVAEPVGGCLPSEVIAICRASLLAPPNDTCVIWSNEHRAWWGPGECGYVRKLAEAGRYLHAIAMAIVQRAQAGRGHMRDNQPPEIVVREVDALASLQW